MDKFRSYKFLKDKTKNKFLNNLVRYGTIEKAAEETGISRQTHYDWRKSSDEYCMRFDEAMGMRADSLEDAAFIRAVEGIEVNDYYKGQKIGSHRVYSDNLLALMLKAARPEKYKERIANEVTTDGASSALGWEDDDDAGNESSE